MIEKLVEVSVRNAKWVIAIVALAAVAAIIFGRELRFDALPDVTGKQVVVLTRAPGFTPEEVEQLVTRKVEVALAGVPGLASQRSLSRYGLSSVTALFDEDADLLRARQLVQERLSGVGSQMPPGADAPELGPLTGGLGEIYQFTLSSPMRTQADLLELVQLRIGPMLASVPGIVEVNPWGGDQRTLDVVADAVRMAQYQVTLADLSQAVADSVGQAPGARLRTGDAGVLLRGVSWPRKPADLADAVVRENDNGSVLRVGDVASVVEGAEPRTGAATADGRGETVYVVLQMLLDDNALEVLESVHAKLAAVREALPKDVVLREVYDRGELVRATLDTVFHNLLEGGVLVVAVLLLMLGSLRAGALVASVIPLSMLGAVAGMRALDVPGNLMSLGALDFGLLVDGGVVMTEAVFHAVQHHGGPIGERVAKTTRAMARPVFYSVAIILIVYLPILTLADVEGAMFRPMAVTVVLALLSALVLSLTFVPAAARLWLRERDVPAKEPFLVPLFERAYRPVLTQALDRPGAVALIALAMVGVGGVAVSRAGIDFVPQLDEGDLVAQTTRDADIAVEAAVRQATLLERAALAVPEVRHVASRIGSPAVATDLMGLEQADVFLDVAPREQWREGLTREQLIAQVQQAILSVDHVEELAFTQPIQMRFNELVGGSVTDVSLSLFGEDLSVLHAHAEAVTEHLQNVPGAADVRVLAPPSVEVMEVRPRALSASQLGLRQSDILDHVRALRSGLEVGSTYEGSLRIPVRVRFGASVDARSLARMPVPTREGSLVPLGQVADVEGRLTPSLINHDGAQRRVVVGFNVRERDLGSVVADAERALAQLPAPEGVVRTWGGQYESLKSAQQRLAIVLPTALALIVGLLLILFRRLGPALLIVTNVPFAAVGGLLALSARDMPISISAAVGFIALSGIAVLNGVVLVSALESELEGGTPPREAARRSALSRLRPVSMTALVAALGFVPMMLATGVGAEVQRPVATVVVGGLVTSTFLTLVILPSLYVWLAELRARRSQ